MSIQVTKQQTNIREEITTLRGKTTPESIVKALGQATDGVGIGTDQPEGTFTVMSHPLNFHPSYPLNQFRALSVGGGDDETSAIVIHANCFKYPTGEGFTDGSSWSSNGAYWATPMIYRSGSSAAGTTGNAQFPFNNWGELILQGSSHGNGYNKGISFVTWNSDHVDENGDPDPYSQSAMQLVMRVSEKGNVGIGTLGTNTNKLQVQSEIGTQALFVGSVEGSTCTMNRDNTDGHVLRFEKDGVLVGHISTNSNSIPSDRNFKRNISDLELGLDFVNKLKPSAYNYKIDDADCPVHYGLIAQDVESALEECGVQKNSSLMLQHSPTEKEAESDYSLDYGKLIPVLTKAIQEQQTIIEQLQSRIDTLENK